MEDTKELLNISQMAEKYDKQYRKQVELLSKSPLAKARGIQEADVYALGKQLEQFDHYTKVSKMNEEVGNVNLLGVIPNIAYDVITAVQGASIVPVIASVQPIEEERGNVYFKQIRSATARGSQSVGSVVTDPRTGVVTPSGYASNGLVAEVGVASTVAATLTYSFTLAANPVKLQSLKVYLKTSGGALVAQGLDNGPASGSSVGQIYGQGLYGTVNYATGVVSITLSADPGNGKVITADYQQNFELASDIPLIDSFFDSKAIAAKVYALKSNIGLLQSYGMSKRFGLVNEEEVARDLVSEINKEIGGDLIRVLSANAVGTTTFSRTAPSGVSFFEHKQTYKDQLAAAESLILANSGRGSISTLIVGYSHAALISTLPGFVKISDGQSLGAHIFGTLDGITVVRVPENGLLAADSGIALWKGLSPFEAPAVYSPFMPLTVTQTMPQSPNPLQSMKAAAVWAGVDSLVPQFATKFNVVA